MNEVVGKLSAMSGSIAVVMISVKPDAVIEVAVLAFVGGIVGLLAKKVGDLIWQGLIKLFKK